MIKNKGQVRQPWNLVAIVTMGRMLGHVPRIGTITFGIRIGTLVLVSLVSIYS
jgi:hypothetical protein